MEQSIQGRGPLATSLGRAVLGGLTVLAVVLTFVQGGTGSSGHALFGSYGGWRVEVDSTGLVRYARGASTLTVQARGDRSSRSGIGERRSDDALEVPLGSAVERFSLTTSGVEQTFAFARAPAKGEAIELALHVEGALTARPDRDGIVFSTADGDVRYGAATWVDAKGRRWPIAEEWSDGTLKLRVPPEVVSGSSFPAILDPLIGPEVEVDTDTTQRGPTPGSPDGVSTSLFGKKWLAAWNSRFKPTHAEVRWTLVDGSGSPTLTAEPTRTINDALLPAVAAHAQGWLLAFSMRSSTSFKFDRVGAVRIRPNGTVMDPAPIVLSTLPDEDIQFVAADCSQTQCLAAWSTYKAGQWTSSARRFDVAGGVPLGPLITLPAGFQGSVAWNGAAFLVTATPLTLVTETGVVTQGTGSCTMNRPVAAPSASGWFVSWTDTSQIFGSRVAADGTLIDGCTHVIAGPPAWAAFGDLSIGTRGAGFLVAWNGYTSFSAPRVRTAVPLDATGTPGPALSLTALAQGKAVYWVYGGATAISCSTDECLLAAPIEGKDLAWDDPNAFHGSEIRGLRLDANGTVLDSPLLLSADAIAQSKPSAGFEGGHYFLAWQEITSDWRVRGAWLNPNGAVEVPPFSLGPKGEGGRNPTVSCGGGRCVAAWREKHDAGESVQAGWATLDGGWEDALDGGWPVTPEESQNGVDSVLSAPASAVIAWHTSTEVFAAVLNGNQASAPVSVGKARSGASIHHVKTGALAGFTAIFWLEANGSGNWFWMRRLTPSGQWLDAQPLLVVTGGWTSAQAALPLMPGSNVLLVLLKSDTADSLTVTMNGAPSVRYRGQPDPTRRVDPSAAVFDGAAARIASTVTLSPNPSGVVEQVAVGLSENIPPWTTPAALVTTTPVASDATLATDGRGNSLLAYSTWDGRANVSTMRIHARMVTADVPDASCTAGCGSGDGGLDAGLGSDAGDAGTLPDIGDSGAFADGGGAGSADAAADAGTPRDAALTDAGGDAADPGDAGAIVADSGDPATADAGCSVCGECDGGACPKDGIATTPCGCSSGSGGAGLFVVPLLVLARRRHRRRQPEAL